MLRVGGGAKVSTLGGGEPQSCVVKKDGSIRMGT